MIVARRIDCETVAAAEACYPDGQMRLYLFPLLAATLAASDTPRVSLPVGTGTTGPWQISRALADVPVDTSTPKLISAPQSSPSDALAVASVSVSFDINEKGVPINIQIDKSSDTKLDDEVIAMIREWRFEAARRGDVALASRAYIDLSIGDLPPEGRRPKKRKP